MKAPTLRAAAVALATGGSARALADKLGFAPPTSLEAVLRKVRMFQTFVDVLLDTCRGQCTGFGYAVFDRDQPAPFAAAGEGLAVRADTTVPDVAFTENTRLNVHSISKTIAAAMIVRALHLNEDVTLASAIGPFLRPDWEPSPAVKAITFEQLLVHDSGLLDFANKVIDERSYAGMELAVQLGVVQPSGQRDYQNVNFALCRVLLPYIDGSLDALALNTMSAVDFNQWSTKHFIDEVRRHLFPSDLPADIVPEPNGATPFTRYYDVDDADVCDIEPLKVTHPEHVGASSWWMSAREYGRFISRLRFSTDYGESGEAWSPWSVISDPVHSIKPSMVKSAVYRLGMTEEQVGDTVPALAKSGGGGGGRPSTAWLGFRDLTAVLCINSSGGDSRRRRRRAQGQERPREGRAQGDRGRRAAVSTARGVQRLALHRPADQLVDVLHQHRARRERRMRPHRRIGDGVAANLIELRGVRPRNDEIGVGGREQQDRAGGNQRGVLAVASLRRPQGLAGRQVQREELPAVAMRQAV